MAFCVWSHLYETFDIILFYSCCCDTVLKDESFLAINFHFLRNIWDFISIHDGEPMVVYYTVKFKYINSNVH